MPSCPTCAQDLSSATALARHKCGEEGSRSERGRRDTRLTPRQIEADRAAGWAKWEAEHSLVPGGYMGYVAKGPLYFTLHPNTPHVEPQKKEQAVS